MKASIFLILCSVVLAELVCRCTDTGDLCITNSVCNPDIDCFCKDESTFESDLITHALVQDSGQEFQIITSSDNDSITNGAIIGSAAAAVMILGFAGWLVYFKTRKHQLSA
jgi:hypothetical protein